MGHLYEAKLTMWECDCGFAMDAIHTEADKETYTCPVCELIEKDEQIKQLQSHLQDALNTLQEIGIMCSFEQTKQIIHISGVVGSAIQRIQEGIQRE